MLLAAAVLASCDAGCGGHIDYTVPPPGNVLGGADALVRTQVVGFPEVSEYVLEAELDVSDVLADAGHATAQPITQGRLIVGAHDDPCGRRTGLRFSEDESVIVVLRWEGPDKGAWDSPWYASSVLVEEPDGSVRFLDTGQRLNERIDQILGEPTVAGLIASMSGPA